jgi:nucleotide-binding universal stress UspA family protein
VVLSRLSESADLVVLGHRHLSAARRMLTRSTTFSVAAHAHCPVVAVPTRSSQRVGHRDVVTVGAHEHGIPEHVLRTAFEIAAGRGAGLRVLHAWHLDPEYDDIVTGRVRDDWAARVRADLLGAAERLADEFPKVDIEAEVQHQWPAEALVEASGSSQVLVVGRHHTPPHLPVRLGSLVRVVLDRAEGPVLVVPN